MGDRTHLNICIHPEDWDALTAENPDLEGLPSLEKILSGEDDSWEICILPTGEIELSLSDVNYGGFEGLNACANRGWRFYGFHGTGSCYGPLSFACAGKDFHYASSDWEGNIVVSTYLIADSVTTNEDEMREALNVHRAEKAVKEQSQQWLANHPG